MNSYEIINNTKIEEIIGKYIIFDNTSDSEDYRALCPFHEDKNPSFSVNTTKQVYYCFGCKAGGNVLTFIKDIEKVSKEEALNILAKNLGIEIEAPDTELLGKVADWFQSKLIIISDYIVERNFQYGIANELRLGYAPSDGLALIRDFKGYEKQLTELGLLTCKYAGTPSELYMSVFMHRLMFPLENQHGIVGFTGRALHEAKTKYLNTEETKYFSRRKFLYGYHKAKEYIKELGFAYIVEGLTDVGSMHHYGYLNTISSLGTAVTEDQIRLLRRITNRIKIAFDGDEAGQKAMIKLVPMLLCFGFETKSIIFPKEHDPDSFLQTKLELDILPILSDIEVLSKYVSKDDFIGIIQKYNMEMIDDKYFSIYGIQKSNVVKKINSSIRSNKLINSDARFHLALLVDAFPNLINKLNESQKESILISKEDSNISKIVFEKNPYSEIKQPEKALEQILNRL